MKKILMNRFFNFSLVGFCFLYFSASLFAGNNTLSQQSLKKSVVKNNINECKEIVIERLIYTNGIDRDAAGEVVNKLTDEEIILLGNNPEDIKKTGFAIIGTILLIALITIIVVGVTAAAAAHQAKLNKAANAEKKLKEAEKNVEEIDSGPKLPEGMAICPLCHGEKKLGNITNRFGAPELCPLCRGEGIVNKMVIAKLKPKNYYGLVNLLSMNTENALYSKGLEQNVDIEANTFSYSEFELNNHSNSTSKRVRVLGGTMVLPNYGKQSKDSISILR